MGDGTQMGADQGAPPDVGKKRGKDQEWMKSYGHRLKGKERVYGGGGSVSFRDGNGGVVRMVPGQVREVPAQVVKRFNRKGYPARFVKPGSQVEGEPVKPDEA